MDEKISNIGNPIYSSIAVVVLLLCGKYSQSKKYKRIHTAGPISHSE